VPPAALQECTAGEEGKDGGGRFWDGGGEAKHEGLAPGLVAAAAIHVKAVVFLEFPLGEADAERGVSSSEGFDAIAVDWNRGSLEDVIMCGPEAELPEAREGRRGWVREGHGGMFYGERIRDSSSGGRGGRC
jgi:hypothetical protein